MFNDAQDHVLRAARAHVDRVVLEAFVAGVDALRRPGGPGACSTGSATSTCSPTIEADLAWFLEHGRLTAARAKAVTSAVNSAVPAAAAARSTLVDAFGVPSESIGATDLEQHRQDEQREHDLPDS